MSSKNSLPQCLKISTMTATSKIKIPQELDMKTVFEKLDINKNIVFVEWNDSRKGFNPKNESLKKKKNKKVFFNQITVIINVQNDFNNIKLFNNGAISMTGVKSAENARKSIQILIDNLKIEGCEIDKFDIVWINSDYDCGYEIKRSNLHQLLVNEYNIFSSFESCIYPGVMSKFFWNKDYKNVPDKLLGRCYCENECNGKGIGEGDGNCKKITISVFQSGSVIIGGKTLEQIKDAFDFISSVFHTHKPELKKIDAHFIEQDIDKNTKKKEKIIFIKKSNIVY